MREYVVRYTVRVDRPELRHATFSPVSPGHRIQCVDRFASCGAAVSRFDALVRGDDDYTSEFVSSVHVVAEDREVERYDHFGPVYRTRGIRTVRKLVTRERHEDRDAWHRVRLQVSAARKPHALHFAFFPLWACELRADQNRRHVAAETDRP